MTDDPTKPPPCLNCGCPWNSCLIHNEFCCDACAHFDDPTAAPTCNCRSCAADRKAAESA